MFYESDNSLNSELLKIESGTDFHFPPHLHGSFELIIVTEGEMTVTIDKKQYSLTPGGAILIFPNQVHSFQTQHHSRHLLCIFSPQLVRAYHTAFSDRIPERNWFAPTPFYIDRLTDLSSQENVLAVKGLLYSVCAEFDASATYLQRPKERETLLLDIFRFVSEHYREDCSLHALSACISYHSVYLSRYFKQYTGLSYSDYVAHYRINEAAYLLKNSKKKIVEIAYECGFDSLRSFNRRFQKIMQRSPAQYRAL